MRNIVISALLIAGALIAAGATLLWWFSPAATLARAQRQWEARPFTDYRMEVESNGCRYEVLVQDEQVVETVELACAPAPFRLPANIMPPQLNVLPRFPTVDKLFGNIQAELAIERGCGGNGCVCDGPMIVRAVYDNQLGYPHHFEVRAAPELRWQYMEYWTRGVPWRGITCRMLGNQNYRISIVSVTAAP